MPIDRAVVTTRLRREHVALAAFWLALLAVVVVHGRAWWQPPAVSAWLTVFVAICVQASPYVLLGVLAAAALRHAPERLLARVARLPSALGVAALAISGVLVPGCECGSVGVASTMLRRGIRAGPTFAFMMSAPSINPVVVAATVAAFPGRPGMVAARVAGSVLAALLLGWIWPRFAGPSADATAHGHGAADLPAELARSLGLLVFGAGAASCVSVLVPPGLLDAVSASPALGVAVLALAAVLMSVCSAADAFVAASFTRFSVTAQVAFMVVGPVVDLKLVAMYLGTFGRAMVVRFVPLALAVTVMSAAVITPALSVQP